MQKIQATVCMLTFNSARNLKRALDSVRDFDEVLINDGGSSDETLSIAAEYGCRVIAQDGKFKNPDNTLKDIGGLRNQTIDAAKHDWVLILDSDESISLGLKEEIAHVVSENSTTLLYRVPMRMYIGAREILHSSNYPGYQYRFFNRRSGARFTKPVHNKLSFDAKLTIGTFRNPWYVFWDEKDVREYNARAFKYISSEVDSLVGITPKYFFFHFIPWHARTILAVTLKTLRDRILHPFSKSAMPLKIEFGRVRYQVHLIIEAGKKALRKTI